MPNEHVHVGDEAGVQGRFANNVGQVIGTICSTASVDIRFADYKSTDDTIMSGEVSDVVLITTSGSMRIVGEMKTLWVVALDLEAATLPHDEAHLRHILGQIAGYMKSSDRNYGFMSTYEETIYLTQEFKRGSWTLFHSRPIHHFTKRESARGLDLTNKVSLRECFWFLIGCALEDDIAGNSLLLREWVQKKKP
ncbi:hypothetical protein BDV39DRAFT_202490 [Aspergillus sergii]|uniref:Fungal-type protein kinase domain-containing protein n=1 Tax=Aspergillus sergii TaxID=1034303 RepID=A0A5N6XAF4_9EURO|nr:hypothetical protein BDV39DRAFT_202490 [Aspergillus sergii]